MIHHKIGNDIILYNNDCLNVLQSFDNESIDLFLCSPPYDDIRTYNNELEWNFKIFKSIANEMFRTLKQGGRIVWVVGDQTKDGTESDTSFIQSRYFTKRLGLRKETMIYNRVSPFPMSEYYNQDFEYMFVFTKGKGKTFNRLKEPKSIKSIKRNENAPSYTYRQKDGTTKKATGKAIERLKKSYDPSNTEKGMSNVWTLGKGYMVSSTDHIAFNHPATFPEELVRRHILSWTNENDIVCDPFSGSGTTGKLCIKLNRKFIGIEKVSKYFNEIMIPRLNKVFNENVSLFE